MISAMKLVIFLLIVLATGSASFWIERSDRGAARLRVRHGPLVTGIVVVLAFLLLQGGVGTVPAGYTGVVLRFGAVTGRILPSGIYLVTPIAEEVEDMDVQVHAERAKADSASHDLQNVTTEVTLNYALIPDQTGAIYRDLRHEYVSRIIVPTIQEAVKSTTAQYDAEQLITRRPEVRDKIALYLENRLKSHGIRVDQVSLTQFSFSEEFNQAIEAKVTATQKALKAENDLARIKTEAEQRIAQAKGEAEAIRIQAESIAKQGGENYVQLKWIEKWNGQLPATLFSGESKSSLLIPIQAPGK